MLRQRRNLRNYMRRQCTPWANDPICLEIWSQQLSFCVFITSDYWRTQRWKPHGRDIIYEIMSNDCTTIERKVSWCENTSKFCGNWRRFDEVLLFMLEGSVGLLGVLSGVFARTVVARATKQTGLGRETAQHSMRRHPRWIQFISFLSTIAAI